jgi:2-keto-4-pentenoate hydratase/2-oxohepta-3-ene-1,7-dioic acid hydratase in catechol pathway
MSSHTPFALGTFEAGDAPAFGGLVVGEDVHVLGDERFVWGALQRWDEALPELQDVADRVAGAEAPHRLGGLRPLPPVQPLGQIFQAGANYRTHVLDLIAAAARRGDGSDGAQPAERERAAEALDERARAGEPFVFQGCAHAVVGAHDDVVLPAGYEQPDWELELAVVIGGRARRIAPERALEVVAGYTIANDLTLRDGLTRPDVPGGIDWLRAKNPPTFLPVGPLLVPAAHAGDPMDLRIRLDVNGRTMQDETTADMLFDVARVIAYISTIAELRPGDLVLTGSPAGNGAHYGVFLAPGDLMTGAITGLGVQRNRCVAEPSLSEPAAARPSQLTGRA